MTHYVSSLTDNSSTGATMGIRNKVWFFFPMITSLPNFDPNFISTIFKVTVIISFIGFKLISNLDQYVPKQMLSLGIDDFDQETEMGKKNTRKSFIASLNSTNHIDMIFIGCPAKSALLQISYIYLSNSLLEEECYWHWMQTMFDTGGQKFDQCLKELII